MKNNWLIIVFIVGVIVTVFVAFNYQGGRDTVSLNEIFPDEGDYDVDIEYEFVDQKNQEQRQVDTIVADQQETVVIEKVLPVEVKPQVVKSEPAVVPEKKVVVPEVKKTVVQASSSAKTLSAYAIQVSSHKSMAKADAMVVKLKAKGFDAYSKMRNLGEKGIWYRVYVGRFSTKQAAQNKLPSVKAIYPNSFVISPKK